MYKRIVLHTLFYLVVTFHFGILFPTPLSAQKAQVVEVEGRVKTEDGNTDRVQLYYGPTNKGLKPLKPGPDGSFLIMVEVNGEFLFEFKLPGYITRQVILSTKVPPQAIEDGLMPSYMDILLLREDGALKPEPPARLSFNPKSYRFEFEDERMRSVKAQRQMAETARSQSPDLAKAEAERLAREEAEAKAKAEEERLAREKAEQAAILMAAEAERLAREEAEAKAKAEAERLAREEAEAKAKAEEEKLAREKAEQAAISMAAAAEAEFKRLRELNNIVSFPNEEARIEALRSGERTALSGRTFVILKKYDTFEMEDANFWGYINFGIGKGNIEVTKAEFERFRKVFNK